MGTHTLRGSSSPLGLGTFITTAADRQKHSQTAGRGNTCSTAVKLTLHNIVAPSLPQLQTDRNTARQTETQ
jgi:hypothetical protein